MGELEQLSTRGYSGACWGYDFDWQTRFEHLPAFTPTIVATCIVTNALVAAHESMGLADALPLCVSAVEFLSRDLNRIEGPGGSFCWSYSPLDRQPVLNATAKGARLCAQVSALAGREDLLETARGSLRFVVAHQLPTGAWPYAVDDPRSWSDNFHTGYVLDSLHEYRSAPATGRSMTRPRPVGVLPGALLRRRLHPAVLRPEPLSDRRHGRSAVAADPLPLRRSGDRAAGGRVVG